MMGAVSLVVGEFGMLAQSLGVGRGFGGSSRRRMGAVNLVVGEFGVLAQ